MERKAILYYAYFMPPSCYIIVPLNSYIVNCSFKLTCMTAQGSPQPTDSSILQSRIRTCICAREGNYLPQYSEDRQTRVSKLRISNSVRVELSETTNTPDFFESKTILCFFLGHFSPSCFLSAWFDYSSGILI